MIELNKIYNENCLTGLTMIESGSVHCCVTSPPYYGLRDYGHADQIGLEETPEKYVDNLVKVFNEVKRVLRPDGTLWLIIGDSYSGSCNGSNDKKYLERKNGKGHENAKRLPVVSGLKPKDLIGIPWMTAFALRSSGWYLRKDNIWDKPNPMPESVTDRCTTAHEYIFHLSKSANYYYDQDAIKQPIADNTIFRMAQQLENQKGSDRVPGKTNGNIKACGPGRTPRKGVDTRGGNQGSEKGIPAMAINGKGVSGHSGYYDSCGNLIGGGMANKKSVWHVTTKPFKEAHFATFPPDLIVDCIKAGSPRGGVILDPFMGAGTTGMVARKLDRNFIGFELNPDYVKIANNRIYDEIGIFI